MAPCLGQECLARPRTSQPGACPSMGAGHLALSVCPPVHQNCQSIDRATFFTRTARASRQHGARLQRTRTKVTVLAFRHKPPPAKDRSERWLPPRSGLAGAAGSQADWFETTHQDKPGRGFSSRPSNIYRPGTTLLHLIALSHTPTLSLSNVFEHKKRSKSSRPPPDGEWRLETDQGR